MLGFRSSIATHGELIQCLPAIALHAVASAEHAMRGSRLLMGLLPDNDRVLENWGKRFQVSPRNVFRLLAQLVRLRGRCPVCRPGTPGSIASRHGCQRSQWLTEDEVAARLRALRADHSAWRSAQDTGQFSLAGAQPKTALLLSANGGSSVWPHSNHAYSQTPTGDWMVTGE